MSLPLLTPWEHATHVEEATREGLLPQALAWPLTALAALGIGLLLWPLYGVAALAIGLVFGRLVALDLTTYTLPNVYTVPLVAVGMFHALEAENITQALLALAFLALLSETAKRSGRQLGMRVGLGGGDLKLLAALFAFMSLTSSFWALAVGCILWLPVAFAKPRAMVPFGVPIIAGWVVLLRFPHLPNWLISTIS